VTNDDSEEEITEADRDRHWQKAAQAESFKNEIL
jgi:hypothetical protein